MSDILPPSHHIVQPDTIDPGQLLENDIEGEPPVHNSPCNNVQVGSGSLFAAMETPSNSSPLSLTNTSSNVESGVDRVQSPTDLNKSVDSFLNHVDHMKNTCDSDIPQFANDLTIGCNTSEGTNAGGHYPCHLCEKEFGSQKDLVKHMLSQKHSPELHGKDPSVSENTFQCACYKKDPRRDNHKRHVTGCRETAYIPFRCEEGHEFHCREEYLGHLDDPEQCGKRRGRPTKTRP